LLAKIKIKFGENEIEIDSRDFYVDNLSVGEVINTLSKHMNANKGRIIVNERTTQPFKNTDSNSQNNQNLLSNLKDAEVNEVEFNEPVLLSLGEIDEKLEILGRDSYFETPRTASEACDQLRQYGWNAGPLDVFKALAKMAFNKKILRNSQENRNYYFMKEALLTN